MSRSLRDRADGVVAHKPCFLERPPPIRFSIPSCGFHSFSNSGAKSCHARWGCFAKPPGAFVVAVVLISVGIGATTTVFAVTNALLLQRLPVRDPESLVQVFLILQNSLRPLRSFSYELYRRLDN